MLTKMVKGQNLKQLTYAEAIHSCMSYAMEKNSNTILIGQGIGDHKGIFGTTTGLQEKYGASRVIESPIAEEMMTGFGLGSSLNGLYPIMTHIRADFAFVAMNQIVNLYAKYKYMFGGQFQPAGLIRLIVGRSWGQGAQHAQSPQSLFSHIPGIRVIMPFSASTILGHYKNEIDRADRLVISLEHRNLYDISFNVSNSPSEGVFDSKVEREGSDVTVVATSIMVLEAVRASQFLFDKYGMHVEVIDMTSTSHPDVELIFQSVKKTGRLVVADTSWSPYGVGAEITRLICQRDPSVLKSPVEVIGMEHTPCPTGKALEDLFYPSVRTLAGAILRVSNMQANELPDGGSYRDYYRKFKGPF
jgi:acetoin:2,6-dichlorophenolindophenol oxidoreductase subunit beta